MKTVFISVFRADFKSGLRSSKIFSEMELSCLFNLNKSFFIESVNVFLSRKSSRLISCSCKFFCNCPFNEIGRDKTLFSRFAAGFDANVANIARVVRYSGHWVFLKVVAFEDNKLWQSVFVNFLYITSQSLWPLFITNWYGLWTQK